MGGGGKMMRRGEQDRESKKVFRYSFIKICRELNGSK